MNISNIIIAKRKELNLTQKGLAEKLHVTNKTISRWERGTSLPDIVMIKKLSIVLNFNLNEVFDGIEVDINDNDVINYEGIKQFRVSYVTSSIFLLFASLLFFFINAALEGGGDIVDDVVGIIFFILGSLCVMSSIVIYVVSVIRYRFIFINKPNNKTYMKDIVISVILIVGLLIVTFLCLY